MKKKISIYQYIIFIIIVYLYSIPRYFSYLPTLPIYDNNEADEVYEITLKRTNEDIDFFKLTDNSVTSAFLPYVEETYNNLVNILTQPLLIYSFSFPKYLINRPRPYQVNENIIKLESNTDKTPSYPAGHAFQAYVLEHILSKKYPEKREIFKNIAFKCDYVRVIGGIHYKSDGEFSKYIVNKLVAMGLI
tara:strand:- start:9199 stop:9768 length:570 start_codon:yes stop_codon:yes gene_type:complete